MGMKILFIVSLFNDAPYIEHCLQAILDQKEKTEMDIVVVDDGSRDNSYLKARKFAQHHPQIQVIHQENRGQASALNRGLKEIGNHQFIAFVESDVQIEKDWLSKNLKNFSDPRVAAVGGILSPFVQDKWIARLVGYEVEYKMQGQHRFPRHLTSANIIYRTAVFGKIGRFRENLINASFDGEFNQRLIKAGWRLYFNPQAHAKHHYKPTLSSFLKRTYAYARFRPYLRLESSYPYDQIIKFQIIILVLIILLAPVFLLNKAVGAGLYLSLFILYLILTLPPILWTVKNKEDTVILALPLVSIPRNLVALAGLFLGTLTYFVRHRRKPWV